MNMEKRSFSAQLAGVALIASMGAMAWAPAQAVAATPLAAASGAPVVRASAASLATRLPVATVSASSSSLPAATAEDPTVTTEDGSVLAYKLVGNGSEAYISRCVSATKHVVIPSEIDGVPVTSIGSFVVSGTLMPSEVFAKTDIESVYIPDSVRYICTWAFSSCEKLSEVRLPQGLSYLGGAFNYCTALKEIAIPAGVTTISSYSFTGCTALESVQLPKGLAKIGEYAFSDCTALKDVSFPSSLEILLEGAFQNCAALTKVDLPSNVTTIFQRAFKSCSNLKAASIPAGANNIGTGAFDPTVLLLVQPNSRGRQFALANGNPYIAGDLSNYNKIGPFGIQEYTGEPLAPVPSLRSADFDIFPMAYAKVAYTDNVNAGTASFTVTSDYVGGSQKGTFTIRAASIDDASMSEIPTQYYVGHPLEPDFTVTFGGKTLKRDTDYTVEYSGNDSEYSDEGRILLKGIGNYSSYKTMYFPIKLGELTVTFESNGGSAVSSIKVPYGKGIGENMPANPTRANYRFRGWYADKALTDSWAQYSSDVKADTTLYARWERVSSGFSDVALNHWVLTQGWLDYVTQSGLMGGYQGKFDPDGQLTRGQVAAILYRIANPDSDATTNPEHYGTDTGFGDGGRERYYYAAVKWLKAQNISTGDKDAAGNSLNRFRPDDPITRQELAALVQRFARTQGADVSGGASIDKFYDARKVDGYARGPLGWCLEKKIITGGQGAASGLLMPRDKATRAQAAKIFTVLKRDVLKK